MMEQSIRIPFALGVQCWTVRQRNYPEWVTCPECVGTKFLTLTLGNGAQHQVACGNCAPGYDAPRGVVKTCEYQNYAETFTPVRVTDLRGDEVMYTDAPEGASAYSCTSSTRMFATQAEAEAAAAKMNEEHAAAMQKQILTNLMHKRRDLAWSVSYWRQKVAGLRRDLERAEERLNTSLARPKPKA